MSTITESGDHINLPKKSLDSELSAKLYNNRAFTERLPYLQFIQRVGESGIQKLFAHNKEIFSFWWSSLITEKSPLKSSAYKKLISALIAQQETDKIDSKQSFNNFKLYHFLKGGLFFAKLMFRIIRARIGIGRIDQRKAAFAAQDYTILSYFPKVDRAKEQQGIFENSYLSTFHHDLAIKRQARYGHVCISVDIDGMKFSDSVKLAHKFSSSENLFLIEEFLCFRNIIEIMWQYICISFRYVMNISAIKRALFYHSAGKCINVWPILQKDFHSSFCGTQLASSLFYSVAFENMVSLLKKGSKIICVCEMQWWERVLYFFARKHGLMTIGYQHTIVPALMLNYFSSPDAMTWNVDGVNYCPQPDFLATVGSVTSGMFVENGWPSERVFMWGAQRFEMLRKLKQPIAWDQKADIVVCAFSICPKESERVLTLLHEAFSGSSAEYKVYLKSHPCLNIRRVVNDLGMVLDPDIFEYSDAPLERIMSQAKAMVVTESSSCFYAIAYGSRVITPLFSDELDCSPLSFISDVPEYVYSASEMRRACDRAVKQPPSEVQLAEFERLFEHYFYFPDNSGEYLDAIDMLKPITM